MNLVAYLLLACVASAVLKVALTAMLVLLLAAVVWGCLFKPAETFGLLSFCLLAEVAQTHPWALVAVLTLCAVTSHASPRRNE